MGERAQAETQAARALGRVTGKHRAELRRLLGDPPDVSQVPESFWAKVEKDTEEQVLALLLLMYIASASHHGGNREQAQPAALAFATGRARETARGFVATSKRLAGNATSPADAAVKVFGPDRIAKMVEHESSRAVTEGAEVGIRAVEDEIKRDKGTSVEVVVRRYWSHSGRRPPRHSLAPIKPCPICSPLERAGNRGVEIKDLPAPFRNGPPAHPRCDCFKRVVVFVDGKKTKQYKEFA